MAVVGVAFRVGLTAQPLKTSGRARFQGGAGKRKAQPSKTSSRARFQEVWVVMVARGTSNPRKRAVVLVFGVVPARGKKTLPSKTSSCARIREVWVVVLARGRFNPRKRAVTLVFGGCGRWWWPKKGHNPKNEHDRSFVGVVVVREG